MSFTSAIVLHVIASNIIDEIKKVTIKPERINDGITLRFLKVPSFFIKERQSDNAIISEINESPTKINASIILSAEFEVIWPPNPSSSLTKPK